MGEAMSWPAIILIMLFILTPMFGKMGKRRGYAKQARPGPRSKPPRTPEPKWLESDEGAEG